MGVCVTTAASVQAGYSVPSRRRVGVITNSHSACQAGPLKYLRADANNNGSGRPVHNDSDAFEETPSDCSSESDYVFDSVSSCSDNVRLRYMLFNASAPGVLLPAPPGEAPPMYQGGSPSSPIHTFVGAAGDSSLLPLYRLKNPSTVSATGNETASDDGGAPGDAVKRPTPRSSEHHLTGGGGGGGSGSNSNTPPGNTSPARGGEPLTPPSDPFVTNVHQHIVPLILSGDARLANMVGSRFGAGFCHTLQSLRFVKSSSFIPLSNALTPMSYGRKRTLSITGGGGATKSRRATQASGGSSSHVKRMRALRGNQATSVVGDAAPAFFSFTRDVMMYGGIDGEGLLFQDWKTVETRRRRQYFRDRARRAIKQLHAKSGISPRRVHAAKKKPPTVGVASGPTQTEVASVLSGKTQQSRNSKKVASDFSSTEDEVDLLSDPEAAAAVMSPLSSSPPSSPTKADKRAVGALLGSGAMKRPIHPRCRLLRYVDVLDSPFIEYGTCRTEIRRYIMQADYIPPASTGNEAIESLGIDVTQDVPTAIASCGDEGTLMVSGSAFPASCGGFGGGEHLLGDFRVLHDEDHFVYEINEFAPKVTTGGGGSTGNVHKLDSIGSSFRGSSPSSSHIMSRQQTMQAPRGPTLSPGASPLGLDVPKSPRGDSSSQLSDDAREMVNRARGTRRRNSGESDTSGYLDVNTNTRNVLSSDGSNSTIQYALTKTPAQRAAARRLRKERMYVVFGETCKYEVDDLKHPGAKAQLEAQPVGPPSHLNRGAPGSPAGVAMLNLNGSTIDVDGASVEDEAGSRSNTDDGAPAEEAPFSWAVSKTFKVLKTFVQHGINSDPNQFTKSLDEDAVLMHRRDVVRIAVWIDDILQLALLNHLSQIATKSCDDLEAYYGADVALQDFDRQRPGTQAPANTRGGSTSNWPHNNDFPNNSSGTDHTLFALAQPANSSTVTAFVPGVGCHPVIRAVTLAAGLRGRRRIRKRVRVLRLKATAQEQLLTPTTPAAAATPLSSNNAAPGNTTGGLQLEPVTPVPSVLLDGDDDDDVGGVVGSGSYSPNTSPAATAVAVRMSTTAGVTSVSGGGASAGKQQHESFASSSRGGTSKSAMMDSYGETHSSTFRGSKVYHTTSAGTNHGATDVLSDSNNTTTVRHPSEGTTDADVTVAPTRLSLFSQAKKSFASTAGTSETPAGGNKPKIPVEQVKASIEVMKVRPPKKTIRRLFDVRMRCAPDLSSYIDVKAMFRAINNFATAVHQVTLAASASQHGSFHNVPSKYASGYFGHDNPNSGAEDGGGGGGMPTFSLPHSSSSEHPLTTNNGLLAAGNVKNHGTPGGIAASSLSSAKSADSKNSTPPTTLVLPPGLLHNGGVVTSSPMISLLPPSIFELQQLCLVTNNPHWDVGTLASAANEPSLPLVTFLAGKGGRDAAMVASALSTVDYPVGEYVMGPDDDEPPGRKRTKSTTIDAVAGARLLAVDSPTAADPSGSSMSQMVAPSQFPPNTTFHHLTSHQRAAQFGLQSLLARLPARESGVSGGGHAGRIGSNVATTLPIPQVSTRSTAPSYGKKSRNGSSVNENSGNAPLASLLLAPSYNATAAPVVLGSFATPGVVGVSDSPTKNGSGSLSGDRGEGPSLGDAGGPGHPQFQSATMPPESSARNAFVPRSSRSVATVAGGPGDSTTLDDTMVSPHTHLLQQSTASGLIQLPIPLSTPMAANASTSSVFAQPRLLGAPLGSNNTPNLKSQVSSPNQAPEGGSSAFAWKERTMTADALKAYIKYQQFLAKQRKRDDSAFERRLLSAPPSIRQLVFGPVPYSRAVVRPGLLSPNQLALQQHQQQLLASVASSFNFQQYQGSTATANEFLPRRNPSTDNFTNGDSDSDVGAQEASRD